VCAKEKDLFGHHVRRDADQRDGESCKHGKVILILSNLVSKPRATTDKCLFIQSDLAGVVTVSMKDEPPLDRNRRQAKHVEAGR